MNKTAIGARLLLISLAAVSVASSATFSYYAELHNPSNSFSSSKSLVRTSFQPVAPITPFNGMLVAGDTLSLTFSAPSGKLFSILPTPAGGIFEAFAVSVWSDGAIVGTSTFKDGDSFQFSGASKAINPPFDFNFEYDLGSRFVAQAFFSQDDVIFKSFTINFVMPTGFSRQYTNQFPNIYFDAIYSSASYLGPIAALIDDPNAPRPSTVPEPATVALTGVAIGSLLLFRARRA